MFVDVHNRITEREKPPENEDIHYLNSSCPNCERSRPEVIDVQSAEVDARLPDRSTGVKHDRVVEPPEDN